MTRRKREWPTGRLRCGAEWSLRIRCRIQGQSMSRLQSGARMAKRALSWKRAGAIGWRDLKSAPGKFGFVVLSVAVGVAALVGVRGFSESFKKTLSVEAKSLMAGDLSARLFHPPSAEEKGKVAAIIEKDGGGIRST